LQKYFRATMPKRLPILKTFVNPENDPNTQEQALQAILVLVKSDQLRYKQDFFLVND
jgi:hypothetical protein